MGGDAPGQEDASGGSASSRVSVVIVGYMDTSSSVFCSGCWPGQVEAGHHVSQVLTDDRDDPDDNFWIVDNCGVCGQEVKYTTAQVLD